VTPPRASGRDRRGGFTLIELLVVIAVLAILALIALPSYLDRLARQQVAEALPLANVLKPAVEAAWAQRRPLPADNAAAGAPPPEKIVNEMVSSVTLQDGAIHIAFGNRASSTLRGHILTVRPASVDDAPTVPITWLCGHAPPPSPMTAKGVDRTDIPPGFLPPRCR
jgi:type IV pilus assembly protein PilA